MRRSMRLWCSAVALATPAGMEYPTLGGVTPVVWEYCHKLAAIAHAVDQTAKPGPWQIEWMKSYRKDVDFSQEMTTLLQQYWGNAAMLVDEGLDAELKALALEERAELEEKVASPDVQDAAAELVQFRISTEDTIGSVSSTWTIETFGRAGGEEATIFATELADMYLTYCRARPEWTVEDISEAGSGGVIKISGAGIYDSLRHEIGTHRIQRVPVTEKNGRLQTSTASVLLLPEPDAFQVDLKESDCEIDMARGSGPGGQGVNTSSNAVRLKHIPTGITIRCHQSRSGAENRKIAMGKLAQMLWKQQFNVAADDEAKQFAAQWGTGERAERIRTYNKDQNRITDHRLNVSINNYSRFLSGDRALIDSFIHPLMKRKREEKTASVMQKIIDRDMNPRLQQDGVAAEA